MDHSHKSKLGHRRKAKGSTPSASSAETFSSDATSDLSGAARLEKVAKIKKALEDGTYRVSNDEVARKLIEHMLEPKE